MRTAEQDCGSAPRYGADAPPAPVRYPRLGPASALRVTCRALGLVLTRPLALTRIDRTRRRTYPICMTNQIERPGVKVWRHRADNRERLIGAGYTVLSEQGYEATTVKEVARVAGVSPGLFHYYFASKEELLIAVLHEAGARYGQLMQELRATVPADRFLEAAFAAVRDRVRQEPGWYRLRYELFALGLRNPTFLPVLGEMLAHIRQMFARAFHGLTGGDEERAQALAALVLACFDGLALQTLAQPEADLAPAYDFVLSMILGTVPRPV